MSFAEDKKPNFFIVGAPKAGTTSLYHYLGGHPDIFLSDLKETNFFSYQQIEKQNLYYQTKNIKTGDAYAEQFSGVTIEKIIGEASVSYLFYRDVARKIHAFNPDAHIVILLRNPVERAYSHYLMDYGLGYIDLEFEEVIFNQTSHPNSDLYYQQYVELGLYEVQIKRYLKWFGPRVSIYLTEHLQQNKEQLLSDLFGTLGVRQMDLSNVTNDHNRYKSARFNWVRKLYGNYTVKSFIKRITGSHFNASIKSMLFKTDAEKPTLNAETRQHLQELYKPDLLATEKLIGQKLDHWYN